MNLHSWSKTNIKITPFSSLPAYSNHFEWYWRVGLVGYDQYTVVSLLSHFFFHSCASLSALHQLQSSENNLFRHRFFTDCKDISAPQWSICYSSFSDWCLYCCISLLRFSPLLLWFFSTIDFFLHRLAGTGWQDLNVDSQYTARGCTESYKASFYGSFNSMSEDEEVETSELP